MFGAHDFTMQCTLYNKVICKNNKLKQFVKRFRANRLGNSSDRPRDGGRILSVVPPRGLRSGMATVRALYASTARRRFSALCYHRLLARREINYVCCRKSCFSPVQDGNWEWSRMKTQGEIEAAACEGINLFEQNYMGRGPKEIHAHLLK
jgi:hypothetical protein